MQPFGVAIASDGTVYVSDRAAQRIVRIDAEQQIVRVVAGGGALDATGSYVEGGFADGPGETARFNGPAGIAFRDETLLVADTQNHCIRQIEEGVVSTFAGACGQQGDAVGTRSNARFALPLGLAVTAAGDVYVADAANGLRKIGAAGQVVAVKLPSAGANGVAFDESSKTLFVGTPNDMLVLRDDAVINAGAYAHSEKPGGKLPFGYPVGHPLGIVALDSIELLYTDLVTGALHYLETYTGTERILSGAGIGGDFRRTGRADGPLSADSFVEPIALALAPDRSVVVADAFARVVRRIAPWESGMLTVPADTLIPAWHAGTYRIAYVGNSTIWDGTTWYDSIEGRLQAQLDTPAFRAAHGMPEVRPMWIAGPKGFAAAADYATYLIGNQLADAIVFQQNSVSLNTAPGPDGCVGLDFGEPWRAAQASTLRLGTAAANAGIPVVAVAAPASIDVSPAEQIWARIGPRASSECILSLREPSRRFHTLLVNLYARSGIPAVDLWPDFLREEQRADARPLFGSTDAHFTALGRMLVAGAVYPVLSKALAERPHTR